MISLFWVRWLFFNLPVILSLLSSSGQDRHQARLKYTWIYVNLNFILLRLFEYDVHRHTLGLLRTSPHFHSLLFSRMAFLHICQDFELFDEYRLYGYKCYQSLVQGYTACPIRYEQEFVVLAISIRHLKYPKRSQICPSFPTAVE